MSKGYDTACETLARAFLPDDAPLKRIQSLAQHIQAAVEEWTDTVWIDTDEELK